MTKTKTQKQRAKAQRNSTVKAVRGLVRRAAPRRRGRGNTITRNAAKLSGGYRDPMYAGRLSQCARDYLNVLNNPFSGNVACVPMEFNFPTLKQNFRAAGTFFTGTAGTGFVMLNPYLGVFQDPVPNATNAINSSLATFASLAFQSYPTLGVSTAITTSPYTSALTQEQATFRLVGAGVRCRNVTPLLNRGGSLVGIETMNHDTLVGQTLAACMLEDSAERCNTNSAGWNTVVYHPQEPSELSFVSGTTAGTSFLGFIAQSASQDGALPAQVYEWECVICVEMKGAQIHGLTPSYSDPVGLGHVQNMTASINTRKPFISDDAGLRLTRIAQFGGAVAGMATTAYRAYKGVSNPRILGGPTIQMVD